MTTVLLGKRTVDDELEKDDRIPTSAASFSEQKPPLGEPIVDITGGLWERWKKPYTDLDSIATQPSVFDDPITCEVYRPKAQYENAHRFDPDARWTWREEKAVIRKIDWRVMLWAGVMFLNTLRMKGMRFDIYIQLCSLLWIWTAIIYLRQNTFSLRYGPGSYHFFQANTNNFLPQLGMTTNDYNLGNSLFRISFLIAELPSQLVSKRVGPDIWIPTQMVVWSIVALCQFWLSGRKSFLATRFLLGFLQGGFIPDVVLYLSYYYTKTELPIRLGFFWTANYIAVIISAFLATGILRLDGVAGHAGWRYLFLIEGVGTILVGVCSFFLLPPGPTQTRAWYRPKGWFTEREEIILVNRILRDDPTKSDMHNREGLTPAAIWKAVRDWRMWPIYLLGLTHMIPVGPPQNYLTLTLRHLGFNTTQSNLLSIPSSVLGLVMLLFCAYLSEIINSRIIATIILQFWALPLLIALYTFNAQTSQWVYFTVVTLITGFPYVHPIQVGWASRNSNSVRTRTISASVYNMFVQPLYKHGNRALIGICSMNIMLYIGTYLFYKSLNKRRERIWNSLSKMQQEEYVETTKDEGNQRLDFRFAY